MSYVQLSHNMLVNYIIDNRQNQLFSEMSLRDIMELPTSRHLLTLVWVTSDKSLNLRWPES